MLTDDQMMRIRMGQSFIGSDMAMRSGIGHDDPKYVVVNDQMEAREYWKAHGRPMDYHDGSDDDMSSDDMPDYGFGNDVGDEDMDYEDMGGDMGGDMYSDDLPHDGDGDGMDDSDGVANQDSAAANEMVDALTQGPGNDPSPSSPDLDLDFSGGAEPRRDPATDLADAVGEYRNREATLDRLALSKKMERSGPTFPSPSPSYGRNRSGRGGREMRSIRR